MISRECGCRARIWNQGEVSFGLLIHIVMLIRRGVPSLPVSIHSFALAEGGVKRWFRLTPRLSPFSFAVATISRAWWILLLMGFSQRTCRPASRHSIVGL